VLCHQRTTLYRHSDGRSQDRGPACSLHSTWCRIAYRLHCCPSMILAGSFACSSSQSSLAAAHWIRDSSSNNNTLWHLLSNPSIMAQLRICASLAFFVDREGPVPPSRILQIDEQERLSWRRQQRARLQWITHPWFEVTARLIVKVNSTLFTESSVDCRIERPTTKLAGSSGRGRMFSYPIGGQ
jgi:hypothetical protein